MRANEPIDIGVRFKAANEDFCGTPLGYGGSEVRENWRRGKGNIEGIFKIENSDWSTKQETDYEYGQIPKIYYM